MTPLCLLLSAQVGINICATKTVDCLLRIANQQQTTIVTLLHRLVNPAKDAPLQWICILEFINQRNGELSAQ